MNVIKHLLGERYTSTRTVTDEYHCLHNGVQWVVRSPFGIHEAAYGDFKRNQQRNLKQLISNRIGV